MRYADLLIVLPAAMAWQACLCRRPSHATYVRMEEIIQVCEWIIHVTYPGTNSVEIIIIFIIKLYSSTILMLVI